MRMCPNRRLCARVPRARCRAALPGSQAVCAAKAGRSGDVGTPAGVPVPEIVLRVVPVGLGGPDLRPGDAERIGAVAQGWAGHPSVLAAAFPRLLQNRHRLASVKRRHPVLRGDAGVPLPSRRCRSWGGPICRPGERCVRCAGRGCDEGFPSPGSTTAHRALGACQGRGGRFGAGARMGSGQSHLNTGGAPRRPIPRQIGQMSEALASSPLCSSYVRPRMFQDFRKISRCDCPVPSEQPPCRAIGSGL